MTARKEKGDPLDPLGVIDRLEVGPVRLEKRRLIAPYRVTRGGATDTLELIYRYEEAVFTPDDEGSLNLASLVAAQVALNYGLFCDELVLHGPLDGTDRKFLREMARNTAREIFVKKFLEANPFLQGAAAELPPVKRDGYLRAKLLFPDAPSGAGSKGGRKPAAPPDWIADPTGHAILSSGGKDSLLTYGLLNEIGREIHPVYINESGRHWFTALNAYRHFSAEVAGTARVWTNADRIFTWMLRHLPFVRENFASVRSDEYPIRLWTVAVFLFGALPILKARGVGRLLIGDEFDTTVKTSFQGIPHYDGLYDQSHYFDTALTRFFHRKGWGVSQFSILRPLSEMLIEKILVERYPELQRHQVSCHAAHKEGDRVHPCGRCEKCRRIVGMLTALGADPGRCGYTREQIDRSLAELAKHGIHQEAEGAEQLAFLLREKGILQGEGIGSGRARKRSEVMKLRFDRERSPMVDIPADLRERLFGIYLAHAEGAVKRSGRIWIDFDPLADPGMKQPYPFESSGTGKPAGPKTARDPSPTAAHILGELTWPEARTRFKEVDIALLPVGSVEQHGPHLPLDTDAFDADYLARRVAEMCRAPRPLVLPLISYGVSYHHADFSGTLSVSPDTLSRLVCDIGMSVARHGITKLVIINGHGGNGPALHFAAQMINRDAHIFTCVDSGETSDPDINALAETPNDVHAGEIETSTALATRPELVKMEAARKFVPRFSSHYLDFSSKRSIGWHAYIAKISPKGILGDPTKASLEKGEKMWAVMIKNLVEFVEDLKSLSLDEIYQKRY